MTPDQALFSLGRDTLSRQPFSVLLGARLIRLAVGYAELRVPLSKDVLQQSGYAHGGLVSYLADNALAFAGGSVLGAEVLMVEFKLNYLRPASGVALTAQARCVHAGSRLAVCVCEVYIINGDEIQDMCAIAQGTIAKRSRGADASLAPQPEKDGRAVA